MQKGSPLLPIFPALSRNLHLHSSAAQSNPSRHPSNITSVYPVSAFHLHPHQHPSSHTALIHSLQVPKPSPYSPIRSTRQLPLYTSSHTHLLIPNSILRDSPTKLLKHFISRTFSFLLPALHIPHASAPYNAVGRITPSYRHNMF